MSAKLGTLTLDLIAKIGNFVEPVKKAEAQTKTSFEAMKKSALTYGAVAASGGATVLAALMPAVTTISSIGIDGMAHDGIDNIPKEGTWLLDKGERVVDSRTNADLKNMIAEGGASKAPNVNVYTLPGETADVSWNNGELDVRIRKIAREEDKRTWGNLGNPNSFEAKQIQRNTTAGVKR